MGIPYYFTYIIKNHNNIIDNLKNISNIHELYLDSNSIIYDSINMDNFENQKQFEANIIKNVIQKIEFIIKSIKPKNFVYIAFDGIPPFAKLNQQKNRRYKNQYQDIIFNKQKKWDTASITPGTNFMNNLDKEITNHFNNSYYKLNLSNQNGEGEHKIFKYIRQQFENNNENTDKNILIYGMDADLIMLSLNHLKYCPNIYLFRETPDFINTINSNFNKDEKYYINIKFLANEIYKILLKNTTNIAYENIIEQDNFYNKLSDYIFICFLLGNDFIPHSPSLNIRTNGITILLELYKQLFDNNQFLTNIHNIKINWKNFKLFLHKIAENEEYFIKNNYDIAIKKSKKYFSDKTEEEKIYKYTCTPQWEKNLENFINPYEKFWEYRYYYCIFNKDIDIENQFISNLSNEYLKILLWTFNYYCNDCISWNYFYNYSYPPLIMDLYKNIPYFDSEISIEYNNTNVHPLTTLSYVLPKNSLNLLPKKIENYLNTHYKEHYNYEHEIKYPFCNYLWEGHVEFTEININDFIKKIETLI